MLSTGRNVPACCTFCYGPQQEASAHSYRSIRTGHVALHRHLTVIKIRTDPMCPKRGKEEKTAHHFLGKCSAIMMASYSIFVSHLIEVNKLKHVLYN